MSRKRPHIQEEESYSDDGDLIIDTKRSPQQDSDGEGDAGDNESGEGDSGGHYRTYTPPPILDDVTETTESEAKSDDILVRHTPSPLESMAVDKESETSLVDVPEDALSASSLSQFHTRMRPYLWMQYPAGTTAEINVIINQKWKAIQATRKDSKQRRRSEVNSLGGVVGAEPDDDEEAGGGRRPQRRAAKNLAKNVYSMGAEEDMEFVDSPASTGTSSAKDTPPVEPGVGSSQRLGEGGARRGKGGGRGGRVKGRKRGGSLKVPPMKIKLIGRTGVSDSPIFFAESLGEQQWEESSEGEKMKKLGVDSENSSLHLGDREDDDVSVYEESSIRGSDSEDEEDDEEEDDDIDRKESEDEHADFCQTCKDGGELLCCDFCPLAYHLKCLVPPMDKIPDGEWHCPRCQARAEPLSGKVERLVTWKWAEHPVKGAESEMDDDVIADGPGSAKKQAPPKKHRFREFLVKWRGKSYWKCSWVSEMRLEVHRQVTLRTFMRKHNMETPPPSNLPPHVRHRHKRRSTTSHPDEKMEEQELTLLRAGVRPSSLLIQRVINKRSKKGKTQYLVKWKELPYEQSTWEDLANETYLKGWKEAIYDYNQLRQRMDPRKLKKAEKRRGKMKTKTDPAEKYEEQPSYIINGTLHNYQLEGVNWLRFSWLQKTNTILADEMGLGKTIQTIVFLYSLVKEDHSNGPFLITAPLSTIVNWEREFEIWAPDLYVVTYSGDRENRAVIRENEFSFVDGAVRSGTKLFKMKKEVPTKFHVLLTSYEFISVDSTILQSIDWEVLVVDEAHRLKNNQSKFFRVLNTYFIKYKLLLTGTPLQNNLEELFHLLNFLNREGFSSLEDFQDEFQDISKEEQVKKLHELLAPHLLRRLKQDVLKNIPSKRELIVRVELSPMQQKYYRWILTRNFEKLNTRGAQPVSLLNVMMDLKKCCNHPYLFPTAQQEAPLTATGYYEGKALIQAGGKFIILEKMLKELKKQGHRVLIFSQMTRMLDILEDFLEYLGYHFERIDGNVTGPERQQSIDRFNAPGATQFVFLLSTRAGGLGINLATADTVIIYDSDWNPHNDIQAFSRAHRIGQANKVMIYRFVTRSSVEERITEVAKRKMMLTHLVVRPGMGSAATQALSKRELDDILRFGTEDLFKEEPAGDQESTSIHYDDGAIRALLDRSGDITDGESEIGQQNILANDYLSSFKVASYVMKEKGEEAETETTEIIKEEAQADPDFWERLLRHHYEQQREVEAATLGKGKRVRKQVNYLDASAADLRALDSDQSSYKQSEEEESELESDVEDVEFSLGKKKQLKPMPLVAQTEGLPPLLSKINGTIHVLGFTPRMRKAFLNSVMRFGIPTSGSFQSNWKPKELKNISENVFNAYTNMFLKHVCEPALPNSDTFSDGVPRESLSRQLVLTRIGTMRLVQNKVAQYSTINGTHSETQTQHSSVIQEPPAKPVSGSTLVLNGHAPSASSSSETVAKIPQPDSTHNASDSAHQKTPGVPTSSAAASSTITSSSAEITSSSTAEITSSSTAEITSSSSASLKKDENSRDSKQTEISSSNSEASIPGDNDGNEMEPCNDGSDSHTNDVKQSHSGSKVSTGSDSCSGEGVTESNSHDPVPVDGSAERESGIGKGAEPMDVEEEGGGGTITTDKTSHKMDTNEATNKQEQQQTNKENKIHDSVIVNPSVSKTPVTVGGANHDGKTPSGAPPRFMFNIADGGFTELHTVWADEKTKGFRPAVWGRHHDYWMLKGICTYGYCRWTEICGDRRFTLLNKAFIPAAETVSDPKSRFLLKRFKLLEQALMVEEQLHRASNAGLVQDPNQSVMQLHSRFTDLDCLVDGHIHLVKECMNGDKNSLLLLRKALGKMEDLLVEMKMDVTRLPTELTKLPSVSKQLKLDEISTLTKMALRGEVVPASVITQAPPTTSVIADGNSMSSTNERTKSHSSSLQKLSSSTKKERTLQQEMKRSKIEEKQVTSSHPAQFTAARPYSTTPTGSFVPIPGNSGMRLQMPEGQQLIVAASSVPYTTLGQTSKPQTVSVGGTGAAQAATIPASYALKVPAGYMDSGQVYQATTLQLVPVSAATAQQIMVWPQAAVVQQQQGKTGSAQQLTVVQGSQLISMAATTNAQGGKGGGSATNASIITID